MLVEAAGRLPTPSLFGIEWARSERVDDGGQLVESRDSCSDSQVVGEPTVDFSDVRQIFGSTIVDRLQLRGSHSQSRQLRLGCLDRVLGSSSDLRLTLKLTPRSVNLGLVLATAQRTVVRVDYCLGSPVLNRGPSDRLLCFREVSFEQVSVRRQGPKERFGGLKARNDGVALLD
jgi:hypothetical protein